MNFRNHKCYPLHAAACHGLTVVFVVALMIYFIPSAVNAQQQRPSDKTSYDISLSPLYQPEVDIDGGGKFSLSSVFLRLGASWSVSPTTSIGVTFKYDVDDYDFSGTTQLGGAEPWNDVRRYGLSLPIFSRLENNWSMGLSPSVDWLQETDADSGDSLSYGATAFALKSFTRDRSLGIGAGVFRSIDDDTELFPFIAVDWRFNERWRLSNPFEADALGPAGLELAYRFNEHWQLSGGGVYRNFRFRLDSDGVAPNGIGENNGIITFLRLRRESDSGINVDFYAGAILDGELELKDSGDDELASSDYSTAPLAALTLSLDF